MNDSEIIYDISNFNFLIGSDEIHIWNLDFYNLENLKKYYDILSKEELLKKNKFQFQKDQIAFGYTRAILRILLSKYLNVSNDKILFKYNDYGKPLLDNSIESNITFNVSHSVQFGLIALTNYDEIGVDIEFKKPDLEFKNIAENFFSEYESKILSELNEKSCQDIFYKIWTRKEAFIKAVGNGMSIPLKSFVVNIDDIDPRVLKIEKIEKRRNYNLYNILIDENYSASLLNIGLKKKVKYFKFDNSFLSNIY